jgi:hypothetical protein
MGYSGVIGATIVDALRALEPTDLPVGARSPPCRSKISKKEPAILTAGSNH